MDVRRLDDGPWTYFAIEGLEARYKPRHGIADQLAFALCLYDPPLYYAQNPPAVRERWPNLYGALIPSDSPYVNRAFENFRRCIGDLLAQTADEQEVPWEHGLLEWLKRVDGHNLDWWLCGSTALAVRGARVRPRDIDINLADGDDYQAQELFLDYLIQPVRPMKGWVCNTFARAFPGTRLEWCGGVLESADRPTPGDTGPAAASRLETVVWRGYEVRVPPLDLQLAVSRSRGLDARVQEIERLMRQGR